jgi:hypothetical protein
MLKYLIGVALVFCAIGGNAVADNYDPALAYKEAKAKKSMKEAFLAVSMAVDRNPKLADELWKDYWDTQVLPTFANRPHIALETLNWAAKKRIASAMLRLSEVYEKGEFGAPTDPQLAADWKAKGRAAASKLTGK